MPLRLEDGVTRPWDERACGWATWGGHLKVLLKWLRDEGCPWTKRAGSFAAEGGHLDVLKWLKDDW